MKIKQIAFFVFAALLFTGFLSAHAQTSAEYFNKAARQYVNSDIPGAGQVLAEGLDRYPNDPKLNALNEKLKKDEENQKQDQQNQNPQNEQDQQKQDSEQKKDGEGEEQTNEDGAEESEKNDEKRGEKSNQEEPSEEPSEMESDLSEREKPWKR